MKESSVPEFTRALTDHKCCPHSREPSRMDHKGAGQVQAPPASVGELGILGGTGSVRIKPATREHRLV